MIKSLLIANRGEIACRIIRTARAMGIRTVAVYSDADAKALHVRVADEAVHIGPSPARESYLVGEKIIAAAKATGAEAVHPGYGFLSENAAFAQAVIDAGLIWVGPKPASIDAMGLKDAAKALMQAAGVPVTPGYMGQNQDPAFLAGQAAQIGYPVLIKAVAGGGGKGMRRVDGAADFADALASCQREAAASFGNDHVLIEKYILSPRHIEVQVFGDSHGNVVHLFERDCSLQRRHQKVIEEAPAPGMDEVTREAICAAAVRAAKAVDYEGAGTIEFIADASEGLRADRIWFMEMNTRLQVEHPVTEEITGVDLVEWQLRVASGEALPKRQDELAINGWAMEARLYAEDPAKGFLPSVGRLDRLRFGQADRIETGVFEGAAVSPFYDPMIAKVVCHAADREDCIDELECALSGTEIWPVRTNAGFLVKALRSEKFRSAEIDTGFIADAGEALIPGNDPDDGVVLVAARIAMDRTMHAMAGFRLNAAPRASIALWFDGKTRVVDLSQAWDETISMGNHEADFYSHKDCVASGYIDGDSVIAFNDGTAYSFDLATRGTGHAHAHDGDILSPMPGKIIAVEVAEGQAVTKGQKLLTLEAMKMEHTLTAPFDGTVSELAATPGAQVQVEALLARIVAADS
ncbi:biotin carboxylase N-terminal domain-containing protein [Novosphingobium sp.]|uniref:acetyl/propionyl/methylcrotonyl-CoA carboxylase subunit alpha n=1 Tax=Novosphingobium sp. TaxID=1874826 RepID=UPI0025E78121|nr:biotin carboxylase N-terminal domain-containing protein [Novosphingobium sp.]